MSKSHLTITQAGLTSLLLTVVGQLVAFVPALAPDKQALISAGSAVIAAAFLVANAVHKLADSNVSARDVESGAINAARTELTKVDFNSLVQDAVDAKSLPDLETKVTLEVQRIMKGLFGDAAGALTTPAPAAPPTGIMSSPTGPPPAAA